MFKKIRKVSFLFALTLFLVLPHSLFVQASPQSEETVDMLIVSKSNITLKQMEDWARRNNATDTFIGLAKLYMQLAPSHGGVNPALAYAQSAKETGYGRFGGVLNESFFNPCGLKNSSGGDDKDPNAHMRFKSWEEGISAHLDHLALYAGAEGYPRLDTLDPRHFPFLKGTAKYAWQLGGKWAGSPSYGTDIISMIQNMMAGAPVKILPAKMFLDNPVNDQVYINKNVIVSGWALNNYGIQNIRIYLNNNFIGETSTGVLREDVNQAFPGYPYGNKSGYYYSVPANLIPEGQSTVRVEAIGRNGEVSKEERTINMVKNTNKPAKLFVDKPVPDQALNGKDVEVSGWALNSTGVKTINVSVNGKFVLSTNTGVNRPDVNNAFPGYIYGEKSGYYTVIPAKYFSKGQNTITVEAIGNDSSSIKENRTVTLGDLNAPAIMKGISTDFQSPQPASTKVKIKANATGSNILYRFWICDGRSWKVVRDYSQSSEYDWIPTGIGDYRIWVDAKNANSSKDVESYYEINYKITPGSININTDKPSPQSMGKTININVSAKGDNLLYKFWIHDGSSWKVVKDFSSSNAYTWTPSKIGSYRIWVDIKSVNSGDTIETYKEINYNVVKEPKVKGISVNLKSPQVFGSSINIKAETEGFSNPIYRFWILDDRGWKIVRDFSESDSFQWNPERSGSQKIWVDVREKSYQEVNYYYEIPYYINPEIKSINLSAANSTTGTISESYIGQNINIIANATGANILYKFWIGDGVNWKVIKDYSSSNSANWNPNLLGNYTVWVEVKASNSPNTYDAYKAVDYSIGSVKPLSLTTSLNSPQDPGKTITLTANGGRALNPLYKFWVYDGSNWTVVKDYSTDNTYNWTPARSGEYRLWVDVKDKSSSNSSDEHKEIIFKINGSKTIVIDPGHNYGGDDGAYSNFYGVRYSERDLNMAVALRVRYYLEQRGYRVILTREPDDYSKDDMRTSLKKRTDLANSVKADFFLSLHHDSSGASATGMSTHYSSYRPSLDNEGVVSGVDPGGYTYDDLLIDTTPCEQARISMEMANKLVNELSSSLNYDNRRAHDHGLSVTRNIDVPSVLLELGFISNYGEVLRCSDSNEIEKKAKKIADIIYDYFK